MIKQEVKDGLLTIFVTLIELLTTVRTALDTFVVSRDLLNVVLIDGAMFTFWQIVRFAGNSTKALALRPVAAILAWALYLMQIVIGVEAHHDWVSVAVRVAGGGLLALDTWSYLVALRQKITQTNKQTQTHTDWRTQLRKVVSGSVYAVLAVCWIPLAALIQGVVVFIHYLRDVDLKVVPASTQTQTLAEIKHTQTRTHSQPRPALPVASTHKHTHTDIVDASYTDTQAGVTYTQTEEGMWVWQCVCGAHSQAQTRGQTDYPSQYQAQKAYGGHTGSQTHRQRLLDAQVDVE